MFNELKELPASIFLRVGLECGKVITSKITATEHRRYNVFGETVNTASRIRDFAENSQILIGSNLYEKRKIDLNSFHWNLSRLKV